MIKKILPISVFVLVFILVALLVLQNILSRNKSQGDASITPTLFQGKQGNTSTTRNGKNNSNSSTNQVGKTNETSTQQPTTSEEFQKKLPIIAPDFTLDHSDRMDKYIVTTTNSDTGRASYDEWVGQNMSLAPLLPTDQVIFSQQSVTELNDALDYAEKNKLSPEQEFKKNTDSILSIMNTMFSPFSPISVPTGGVVIPTAVPTGETPTQGPTPPIETSPTPTSTRNIPSDLLPKPLPPISSKAISFKQSIESCLTNRSVYETASSQTGVSWEILAAIHYIEGSCKSTLSLASGREIGTNEPDIVRGGGCSSGVTGPGVPIPLPGGGCGFSTLLDSAIYAGNHFKGKIGKVPSNFQELTKAFSRYNGGGNSNCGRTPYSNCPKLFEGEDDAYVMNWFDNKHDPMYLVYCADLTKCNPPRTFARPGAATIIRLVTNQL